ncbi:MAG: O-antigen ligase family protein [Flavobacteriales bacterium]|nr:O-antigen ligase family protein [Flavobacteriales bacterium]
MASSLKIEGLERALLILGSLLFTVLCGVAITLDNYTLCFLPILVFGGYLLLYHTQQLLLFIALATPLSFNFENLGAFGGIGFYFPTEPLLFGLMFLYILKVLSGYRERKELMRHPLTVAIVFNLIWITVAVFNSVDVVVSVKFLISRLWFVLVMYFMFNSYFENRYLIKQFFVTLIFSMAVTILYTMMMHASHGFSEESGHWVMWPFFKDHTSYGAIIALLFPMVVFHFRRAKKLSIEQFLWTIALSIFSAGLFLSYTRAAWLSLVGAVGVYFLIKLRIDYKLVVFTIFLLISGFFAFQDQIIHELERNQQDSSDSFAEHVQSITNISSDASNLERLNRWNSAWKMFLEKPILGHGPGTYMFEYARYQKSSDKTIISTNQGDGGNAHSEYLGPLSESGIFGMLTILIVFIASLNTGIRLYYQLDHDIYLKGVVMCIVLGLVTYYLHGILNNFLDTDKASVPIWGSMSVLVAISIYHRKKSLKSAAE